MLVLTWNLFHGRSVPDAPREQLADFATRLAGWQWDVALLQEVPPWWPPELGRASGASGRTALTSRNWVLPVSRWAARHRPDVIKSWGGGANAIQQYLAAGLVDEMTLNVAPVLLGSGERLFENVGAPDRSLELVEAIDGPDASHLKYRLA